VPDETDGIEEVEVITTAVGDDGTTGTNATFATAFDTAVVSAQNEHK